MFIQKQIYTTMKWVRRRHEPINKENFRKGGKTLVQKTQVMLTVSERKDTEITLEEKKI